MSAYEDLDGIDGPWEAAMAESIAADRRALRLQARRDAEAVKRAEDRSSKPTCDHEDLVMLPGGGYICGTCAESWQEGDRLTDVAHIREQIEAGTYLNDAKLRAVADSPRLAEELREWDAGCAAEENAEVRRLEVTCIGLDLDTDDACLCRACVDRRAGGRE